MGRLPDALFVVDTRHEQIAVDEARKLKIPVIASSTPIATRPGGLPHPGNDDALRAIRLFASRVATPSPRDARCGSRRRPRPRPRPPRRNRGRGPAAPRAGAHRGGRPAGAATSPASV